MGGGYTLTKWNYGSKQSHGTRKHGIQEPVQCSWKYTVCSASQHISSLSSKKAESEFSIVILGSFSQTLLQTFYLNFVMFS